MGTTEELVHKERFAETSTLSELTKRQLLLRSLQAGPKYSKYS